MIGPSDREIVGKWWTHNDKIVAEQNVNLREALSKLANEVLGSLPLMEPLARREFGNTNYAILIQRAEEARTLLAEIEARS